MIAKYISYVNNDLLLGVLQINQEEIYSDCSNVILGCPVHVECSILESIEKIHDTAMNIVVFELTIPTEKVTKCILTFSGNFKCTDPLKIQPKFCQRDTQCPLNIFSNLCATPQLINSQLKDNVKQCARINFGNSVHNFHKFSFTRGIEFLHLPHYSSLKSTGHQRVWHDKSTAGLRGTGEVNGVSLNHANL